MHDAIKEVPDVSEVTIHGGRARQVTVDLEPARLASYDVDPLAVHRAIVASNTLLPASAIVSGNARETVEARVTVPVLYYMTHRRRRDRAVPGGSNQVGPGSH